MIPLLTTEPPPAVTCEGCGACCLLLSVPPYGASELGALPPAVRADYDSLQATRALLAKVAQSDLHPCGFLDLVTRKCRHHESKPETCRSFEVGGHGCWLHRRAAGLLA